MSCPRITIVGAGIAGLTLGRCLKARGIPTVIIERAPLSPRFNYGITLHRWAYSRLAVLLRMDEETFREKLAVDENQGGKGNIESNDMHPGFEVADGSFRCNRHRLETLLRDGQDIRWEQTVKYIKSFPSKLTLQLHDGICVDSDIIVGADGIHSALRRTLSPTTESAVHNYIVFNGRRAMSLAAYRGEFAPYMQKTTVLYGHDGNVLLQISINDITPTEAILSYTYSRPAYDGDPLHRPDRTLTEAGNIPDAFYIEIDKLGIVAPPFSQMFDSKMVRQDRILHWLMRSVTTPNQELQAMISRNIFLIGDAAHATPILGSEGANRAIKGALDLTSHLVQRLTHPEYSYELGYREWSTSLEENEKKLFDMHNTMRAAL